MERELILPVKDCNYDRKKLEMEIETMKRLLPYVESFSTFVTINDIFDIHSHKLITRSNKIRKAFEEGSDRTAKYNVFCKN